MLMPQAGRLSLVNMDGRKIKGQELPGPVAGLLLDLYEEVPHDSAIYRWNSRTKSWGTYDQEDIDVFDGLIRALVERGWTFTSIANVIGVTREAVRQRANRGDTRWVDKDVLNDLPIPPLKPVPEPHYREPRPSLSDETAAYLKEMQRRTAPLNGGYPADHPIREEAKRMMAVVQREIDRGVSAYSISRTLGVTPAAIYSRLTRYGLRGKPYPSQGLIKGRAKWEKESSSS